MTRLRVPDQCLLILGIIGTLMGHPEKRYDHMLHIIDRQMRLEREEKGRIERSKGLPGHIAAQEHNSGHWADLTKAEPK